MAQIYKGTNQRSMMDRYLQVAVDEVKKKDAGHTDEELCWCVEAAQVDAQHSELLH